MNQELSLKHHHFVVDRLRSLMKDHDLAALVSITNENFTYLNAYSSTFLELFRMPGLAMAALPQNGDPFGVCSDFERPSQESFGQIRDWYDFPMWIYIDDQFVPVDERAIKSTRTEYFEADRPAMLLAEKLKAVCADHGRIGIEMGALPVPLWNSLKQVLPRADFIDATNLFYQARAVKTPYEIECMRYGAARQEEIMFEAMSEVGLGMSHAEILFKIKCRAMSTPYIDAIRFLGVSIGPLFTPSLQPYDVTVKEGDLIKYDGVLVVRGYGADQARTFIAGTPSDQQKRISDILVKAHREALKMFRPGAIPSEIYQQAMSVLHQSGLPDYLRGHIGHSLGLDQKIEEPPFLSAQNRIPLVPGNVLTLELPYYAHAFGSIMNEDIVLITEDGHHCLTRAETRLHPIGIQV